MIEEKNVELMMRITLQMNDIMRQHVRSIFLSSHC